MYISFIESHLKQTAEQIRISFMQDAAYYITFWNNTEIPYLVTSNSQQNIFWWDFKSSANHSLKVCFILVLSKTSHFPCTSHFNSKLKVCTSKPWKGKLWYLDISRNRMNKKTLFICRSAAPNRCLKQACIWVSNGHCYFF